MTTVPTSNWVFASDGYDVEQQRVRNALYALAAGGFGTSGGPLLARASAERWVVAAGVYDGDGPETHLLAGPVLFGLAVADADDTFRRVLDLRRGVLREEITVDARTVELTRFVSLVRPGVVAVRTRLPAGVDRGVAYLVAGRRRRYTPRGDTPDRRQGDSALPAPRADPPVDEGASAKASWMRVHGTRGGIVAAVREERRDRVVDDFVAIVADASSLPDPDVALRRVDEAVTTGFDALLTEHEAAWQARWEEADVVIEGDDELQRATRFALFHLMASVAEADESAVGARGVTGTGYRGHVFWDADTFVLPFLAATHPKAARAMLEYRIRRLPAARDAARALRRGGARFPWESARTGRDVTPTSTKDRSGRVVPIRTGQLEDHIVADIAWATCEYIDWSGDEEFAGGAGLTLLVDTARYWASRARLESDGTAHIYGVIGPDEYHEPVDDNAYTNVMARWNLRRAANAVETSSRDGRDVDAGERQAWRALAAALVDGYDPATRVYEQFAGYFRLEPLVIEEVAPFRPIAADLLLGSERVRASQVVKQADVLMLHHLVPDEVVPGTLGPNLGFYEPRTAHGSSLSPAIHASLYARVHDFDRALDALRIASRIDLDDLTGSTGGGLHLATMGGLWQALAFGFAGIRPRAGQLAVDPHLPPAWTALDIRVRFRGRRVRIRAEHGRIGISADGRTDVIVGEAPITVDGRAVTLERRSDEWEVVA